MGELAFKCQYNYKIKKRSYLILFFQSVTKTYASTIGGGPAVNLFYISVNMFEDAKVISAQL